MRSSSTPPSLPPKVVDGDAERRRLAVHRAAGGDDQVAERDQALRVDGVLGDDQRRQAQRADVVALLLRPGQHDRMQVVLAPEMVEHLREERVRAAVVEETSGGVRTTTSVRCGSSDMASTTDRSVRSQPGSTPSGPRTAAASGADAVAGEPFGGDRRERLTCVAAPEAQLVLEPGELVVEGRRAGNVESAGRDRELVGAVRKGVVEAAASRPAAQGAEPRRQGSSLPSLERPPWRPKTSASIPWSSRSSSVARSSARSRRPRRRELGGSRSAAGTPHAPAP